MQSTTKGKKVPADIIRHNLLVRVCRLYYLCNLTHQEIADREGLSRIKVTRLLKEAVDKKIIEFNIRDPFVHALELEEELLRTFNLKQAVVTPTPVTEGEIYDILGRFAADFLVRHLTNNLNMGIGWGRTLNGMLPYLVPERKVQCLRKILSLKRPAARIK